ncbi:MAG: hypothetical protein WCB97_12725 [Thiobacillus sp.]
MSDSENENSAAYAELQSAIKKAESLVVELQETTEALKSTSKQAQADAQAASSSLTEANTSLSQIKAARDDALAILEKAKTDSAKTAEIARTADEKDQRVDSYETQLKDLTKQFDVLNQKVEKLLPGATGIGLSNSFKERKEALSTPIILYLSLFLISILGFIAFGFWALLAPSIKEIEDFFRFALERSPIIVGLVLLEEFSRRQFQSLTKLEEDYAYKESISIAFDGYKKAMTEVDSDASSSLAHLLGTNVIGTLDQRPGRLIDAEKESSAPLENILENMIGSGETGSGIKEVARLFKNVRSSLRGQWTLRGLAILLVLMVGFTAGYFLANHKTPVTLTLQKTDISEARQ